MRRTDKCQSNHKGNQSTLSAFRDGRGHVEPASSNETSCGMNILFSRPYCFAIISSLLINWWKSALLRITSVNSLFSLQTSGVKVTDEVIAVFNDMKVRKAFANEEEKRKRKKAILFCLSKDLKNIVLDEGKEILLGDLGTTVQDPYQHFVKMLPPEDCRYALYDATYETKETKKEDLVFIFW